MIAEQLRDNYHHAKWALVLRGLLGITIALLIVIRPFDSVAAFALVIAVWALFDGIVRIVHAFNLRDVMSDWWMLLIAGIVGVVFGFAALYYYPALSLSFAVVWTALWLITAGLLGVYFAVQERRAAESWGWTMTWGVIAVLAGISAMAYPGATLAWLMGLIAAFGLIGGIAMLVGAFRMQTIEHHVGQIMHPASR
jgi:uncharacterized membrane protein HdeD (DUF308 family)